MRTDIEIAQNTKLQPIDDIAKKMNIPSDQLEHYGKYKAKINVDPKELDKKAGKLILVTSINPTPAGEGKTTMSVGLGDALQRIGKKTAIALREPSLGPVFGMKGGAAGGGYAQVVPMEDLNLHFTGDMHAIGAANNLAAAMLDNHIQQGNQLNIDPRRITWKRAVDMNDRQLRNITSGLGGPTNGVPREDGFEITVASEIMAVLCLAESLADLKERLSRCILGYTYENEPVTVGDIKAEGAMTVLLKEALKPNLVQTLEGTPAFIHGGPFANIAHGCNSVLATKTALSHADYVVTEGGFGADLGAEKFFDIKCRTSNLKPDAVVVVATIRALKMHGGLAKEKLHHENLNALSKGFANLKKHVKNMKEVFGMNAVVAINSFSADTSTEKNLLIKLCEAEGFRVVLADVWSQGGAGGEKMARAVVEICEKPVTLTYPYALEESIETKITKIVQKIYGGAGVDWSKTARHSLRQLEDLGFNHLPVCMAKTQYSLSDNPTLLGQPKGFNVSVQDLTISAGAGFIVVLTGDVLKMPGLPKTPAAENITIDQNGKITGLF
ncbi:MAG TPA: formate--tetrahydrofolate ligase [Candidatus Atopostipes pullistercoris]|uniref:Formate--tetrahydrofolate ligase n=1 Tax=Candidatus Atopostipes pullistercoris TaxID=2838467 RepID=A0A9D2JYM9_9LACT|nr:formate--tetrahydrofolate ligase [Candidatus Atopostipes pullistercoris]